MYRTNVHGYATELELVANNLQRKRVSGARFGATLANLGDIDRDGFEDFAVGAPFEVEGQGQGVVYVYRGSASFIFEGMIDIF